MSEIPAINPSIRQADKTRSIAFDGIERKSRWVTSDANGIAEYVMMLRMQPPYETWAMDAMVQARAALNEALAIVTAAIDTYEKLPKDNP